MINHKSNILVSICCVTYNHASFIRKALDGFLMQEPPSCMPKDAKLSDWCEILIHDDCSTDGTTEIVHEYAAKYPDVIFPLYEEVNQFSRGGAGKMDLYNYNRVRGRYVATCEGDDYWTDSHKLQKQVDFMETHPKYSICFHGYTVHDIRSKQVYKSTEFEYLHKLPNATQEGVDITARDYLFRIMGGQPLTMLFRFSMFDFDWRNQYKYYRDTHEIYHLLKAGKGYWMNFDGGIYNKHNGGISSSVSIDKSVWEEREHVLELYKHTKDKVLKEYLINILHWNYDVYNRDSKNADFHRMMLRFWRRVPLISMRTYIEIIKHNCKQIFKKILH